MSKAPNSSQRVVFFANCVYGDHVAGGDIHFFQMARAAIAAGYEVHFFGGHALKEHLKKQGIGATQTLTDRKKIPLLQDRTLGGQLRLLVNYLGRFWRTLARLGEIRAANLVYAATDYWFDALPVIFSRADKKMMILGMDAPSLREIILRSRPDVPASRLNSIYYWASQNLSLRLFRQMRKKILLYVHPAMKPRLLRIGYREEELIFVSNGMDLNTANQIPLQKKEFDVIWLGRMHRQKGIEDLLATLAFLKQAVPDFRAALVGRLDELAPRLAELNLLDCVYLAGLVPEAEKFRLFKASRVFLMPSRQESWGIVIAEALACEIPVTAYELPAYRPIFGGLIDYVPAFDLGQFKQKALAAVEKSRCGKTALNTEKMSALKAAHSWEAAGRRFLTVLDSFNHD
jgi:glycosyltransferase involved in cell wall biosynthesis